MSKKEILFSILKDLRLTISLIVGVICYITGIAMLAPISFILIFNFFDIVGFRDLLNGQHRQYDTNTAAYRIIQFMFEVSLLTIIYLSYGPIILIASKLLHLFAIQDIIYYIIGNYKFPKNWGWLYWTPIGWMWNKSINIPNKYIMTQAIIGTIFVYGMMILFS